MYQQALHRRSRLSFLWDVICDVLSRSSLEYLLHTSRLLQSPGFFNDSAAELLAAALRNAQNGFQTMFQTKSLFLQGINLVHLLEIKLPVSRDSTKPLLIQGIDEVHTASPLFPTHSFPSIMGLSITSTGPAGFMCRASASHALSKHPPSLQAFRLPCP
jgi:hypothetical protein